MKRDKAISILQKHEHSLKSFGVKSLAIFGSVARDEAHPESDIDILVEFSEPPTFDRYMDLKFYLEDRLGQSVDLVSHKMLKPQIRQAVEKEAIRVA
ncbi:nucleotidyltransferase family protein [Altericista sp. CCNU0014]|uniref:nucleotidyltransferase family protein n=1 Tax=Altericista sp. CCNU0014 TaxID=3082949 RepID=UPI00384CF461